MKIPGCLPPRTGSQHVPGPSCRPLHSVSWPWWPESAGPLPPSAPPHPFFFLPLRFPMKLFYILLTGIPGKPFFVVLFSMVRRKTLRILNLPTISHLNKLVSWAGAASPTYSDCCIPRLPDLSPFLFHSLSYLRPAQNMGFPRPPGRSPLSARDLGFPERCTVNEMWHCHMYLDKIYQWMN